MIKAKYVVGSRYFKNGKWVYVYTLTGTKEELAQYKEVKGEFYRESPEGVPQHFSSDVPESATSEFRDGYKGESFNLVVQQNAKGELRIYDVVDQDVLDIKEADSKGYGTEMRALIAQEARAARKAAGIPTAVARPVVKSAEKP